MGAAFSASPCSESHRFGTPVLTCTSAIDPPCFVPSALPLLRPCPPPTWLSPFPTAHLTPAHLLSPASSTKSSLTTPALYHLGPVH